MQVSISPVLSGEWISPFYAVRPLPASSFINMTNIRLPSDALAAPNLPSEGARQMEPDGDTFEEPDEFLPLSEEGALIMHGVPHRPL